MAVGESRSELLLWLNATLHLQYTKVEQCGTGAAYCQLVDSIYEDVPMTRVKFDSKNEYESLNNMKVLQAAFNKHGITKGINVERLVKCRLQDNLELLQWFKRYWMENKDVHVEYDAVGRREKRRVAGQGSRGSSVGTRVSSRGDSRAGSSAGTRADSRTGSGTTSGTGPRTTSGTGPRTTSSTNAEPLVDSLTSELDEYKISIGSLETERNFYFNKLRDIEILAENTSETPDDIPLHDFIKQIQTILYSTEEGFQVGDEAGDDVDDVESF